MTPRCTRSRMKSCEFGSPISAAASSRSRSRTERRSTTMWCSGSTTSRTTCPPGGFWRAARAYRQPDRRRRLHPGRAHLTIYRKTRNTRPCAGRHGFDKLFWRVDEAGDTHLLLALVSPDGDQGFPGELSVKARYSVEGYTLRLSLKAVTSKPTPVSLSAHPYFNLAGVSAGDIFGHEITIAANAFLPTDRQQIPTGEIRPVDGAVFDLRQPTAIGTRIRRVDPQLLFGKGYGHYFVLGDSTADHLRVAALVHEAQSGRALEVLTTQPGTQFYTGNNLTGSVAGRGVPIVSPQDLRSSRRGSRMHPIGRNSQALYFSRERFTDR